MSAAPRAPRFYHEPWVVAFAMVACPPLGVILLWGSGRIERRFKYASTGVFIFAVLAVAGAEEETSFLQRAFERTGGIVCERAARGFLRIDRPARAREMVEWALSFQPDGGTIAYTGARVAAALGDEVGRGRWLHMAVRPEEEDVPRARAWIRELGKYHVERGNLAGAKKALALLEDGPEPSISGGVLRASIEIAEGKPRRAERSARRVIRAFVAGGLAPAYAEISRARAVLDDHEGAAVMALESYRHDVDRDLREPIQAFAEAGGLDPVPFRAAAAAYHLRGSFGSPLLEQGDSAASERLLAAIAKRHPDFPAIDGVLHSQASHWFYEAEDFEKALGIYRVIVDEHPGAETWCRALVQMAKCHGELEQYPEALRTLQRVEADCPGGLQRMAERVRADLVVRKRLAD